MSYNVESTRQEVDGLMDGALTLHVVCRSAAGHALGRQSSVALFDDIITQLLSQLGSGPPAATSDEIAAVPTVTVTQEHLGRAAQCTICMEEFTLSEQVRCLPCAHIYHSDCIVTWLELHGTCPICRTRVDAAAGRRDGLKSTVAEPTAAAVNEQTASSSADDVNSLSVPDVDDPVASILDEVRSVLHSGSSTDAVRQRSNHSTTQNGMEQSADVRVGRGIYGVYSNHDVYSSSVDSSPSGLHDNLPNVDSSTTTARQQDNTSNSIIRPTDDITTSKPASCTTNVTADVGMHIQSDSTANASLLESSGVISPSSERALGSSVDPDTLTLPSDACHPSQLSRAAVTGSDKQKSVDVASTMELSPLPVATSTAEHGISMRTDAGPSSGALNQPTSSVD